MPPAPRRQRRRPSAGAPRFDPASFTDGLNPEQRAAVEHRGGPLLVVAGAGSGKTRVLTSRIGHLIATGTVAPDRVLAITFTNKAAREMRDRLAASLGPTAQDLWVSTFHSACVRMLRPFAGHVGLTRHFTILDEEDCRRLLRDIADDLDIDVNAVPVAGARAAISGAKNRLVDPRSFSIGTRDARANAHARMYAAYQERLAGADAVDFDDLLVHVVTLLRDVPEVAAHYRERFEHVLVDEFQDTNRAQAAIVDALVADHRNLCCVGDGDQSIYGFRAADVGNILHFAETYPDATTILLERNYRSTGVILDAANAVIARNEERPDKRLWTDVEGGVPVALRHADDEADEAAWLASEARSLIESGHRPGDLAVLCRAKALARPIEAELVRAGVACRTVGGTPFFERREIRDLLAYLRIAVNRDDELSFRRCVNVPRRAMGDASIKRVREFARRYDLGLAATLERRDEIEDLPVRAAEGLDAFCALLDRVRRAGESAGPAAALQTVVEAGYLDHLLAAAADADERAWREESVGQLLAIASDHGSIEDLLDAASLVMEADDADGDDRSQLLLMTVHASKGLEFPVVFVVGMEEGVFPDRRCLEGAELAEERRLAYVAITRARERLYLSRARRRRMRNQLVMNEPSRFLDEVPPELVRDLDEPEDTAPDGASRFAALRATLGA